MERNKCTTKCTIVDYLGNKSKIHHSLRRLINNKGMKITPYLKIYKMGCVVLKKSRKLPCVSSQPGIRAIGIGEYDAANIIQTTGIGVTSLPAIYDTNTIARLELKILQQILENGVSGGDSRSSGVTGNI